MPILTPSWSPASKILWRSRFFGGAALQAFTRIADIVAIKIVVDAVEHNEDLVRTSFSFVVLYGGAYFVKALLQIDKLKCAEALARLNFSSDSIVSWARTHLIEQHLIASSILSALMICLVAGYLSLVSGIAFSIFFIAAVGVSGFYARGFRTYHNAAHSQESSYERVRKRILRTNVISALVHLAGMPLFGLVAWLALNGHATMGAAVILFLAAKLLVNSTSSLAAPLLRMARAMSQVDLATRSIRRASQPVKHRT